MIRIIVLGAGFGGLEVSSALSSALGEEADIVLALGADLDPGATPGLREAGHEYYTTQSAFAARHVLERFGGGQVIVGVTSTPFKCPPAPSETALLVHDYLTERGLRNKSAIALVMPMGTPLPPAPAASQALLLAFAERGIAWHPDRSVVTFRPGQAPFGDFEAPSELLAADKAEFAASRIQHWF